MDELIRLQLSDAPPPEIANVVLQLSIPSTFLDGHSAVEACLVTLRAHGYIEQEQEEIHTRLCLDEAISNAIKHGNKQAKEKIVNLAVFETDDGWGFQVTDEGEGFDPHLIPNPLENIESDHGRGVFLIRSFMDEIYYYQGGRCLRLVKQKAR